MSNYLNRFYPWQALKLMTKAAMPTNKQTLTHVKSPLPKEKAADAVQSILENLDTHSLNFSVHRKTSSIPNAGRGVYLKGTRQNPGSIVCFYPGTIYLPAEPILFVSLANQYILKCVDSLYVDGKPTGLSARVYRSIYHRENWPGAIQFSDWSWLDTDDTKLVNPLAVGQFVNNGTNEYKANVCYQEVDLPTNFPNDLKRYIPNMYWNTHAWSSQQMRVVVLVSLRDIEPGEELFSTYMDLV